MAKSNKNKKKSKITKSRKELRKDKRQQKKENKRNFFSKKKKPAKLSANKPNQQEPDSDNEQLPTVEDDVASEIESDFELSDNEINQKLNSIQKKPEPKKSVPKEKPGGSSQPDRLLVEQLKMKKQEQELQKKMRKRRIEQLKDANEEEDKMIRRLEKKLRIDKHKNDKSVHKMFNDGLDYALELCLPDNIEKMYKAAKEATQSVDSDDGFEEDLAAAMGGGGVGKATKRKRHEEAKQKNKQKKLSKAEAIYFKDDFDMSGTDSEFGGESEDEKEAKLLNDSEDSDFDILDGGDENDESESSVSAEEAENCGEESASEEEEDEGSVEEEGEGSEEEEDSELGEEEGDESGEDEDDGAGSEANMSPKKIKNRKINEKSAKDDSKDESSEYDEEDTQLTSNEHDNDGIKRNDTKSTPTGDVWEDIYGRKRSKDGAVVEEKTKYIPPHVRARLEAENPSESKRKEKLANLQRHCKGFLNRLSEANIHKIASDIENLYRSNSRFDMNNTLTKLINEAIVSHVLTPERMVLEYAMLIAILHANVGSEVGAHFLESLVTSIDKNIKSIHALEVENKQLDNTLYILCHLYTFKIFQHSLIYEIVNRLSENLCEKSVECLLLVLRSVGFQLRKDDPVALKEFILLIQKKASESPLELRENARLKFMTEVLMAIKNNNMTKIPQYDPSLAEHLKKILKAMMVNGKYVTTLNITIDDLLNADEKGKWWVVGSAWSGNIKDINSAKTIEKQEKEKFSDQLLILAKQQRMNTEDRKNAFCIIMSAEDYINAFERLLHLSIKDQRVIVTVIIHCCLSEKTFNPYYGALAQKFCDYDRKYQLAIQFALWDRIKEIRSGSKQEMRNLAQLLMYLISKGGQPLSVLKVIEFGEMDKVTLRFVRQIMLGLLLGNDEECMQVFARIAPSAKLALFKDSIRLFMHHFLLKGSQNKVEPDKIELLKRRIRVVDEALQTRDSKIKL